MSEKEYKTELPELAEFMDEFDIVLKNAAKFEMPDVPWSANILISIDRGYDLPGITVDIVKKMIENGCQFRSTQVAAVQSFNIPGDPKMAEIMWNQSFAFIEKCSIAERSNGKRIEDEPVAFCIDISECASSISSKELHDRLQTLHDIKGSFIYIFRVPYLDDKEMKKVEAVISDIFPLRVLRIAPLTDDQLVTYLRHKLENSKVEVAGDADEMLGKLIEYEKSDGRFDGPETMNKLAANIIYKKLSRITKEKKVSLSKDELAKIYSMLKADERDPELVLEKLYSTGQPSKKIGF